MASSAKIYPRLWMTILHPSPHQTAGLPLLSPKNRDMQGPPCGSVSPPLGMCRSSFHLAQFPRASPTHWTLACSATMSTLPMEPSSLAPTKPTSCACWPCVSAVPDLVQHECRHAGRLRCPAPACLASLGSVANLTAHLRNHHSGVILAEADARRLSLGRCQHCKGYFRNVNQHARGCRERPGCTNPRTTARGTARPAGASSSTAAGSAARLAQSRAPATVLGAPIGLIWTFGPPGGRSGSSQQMSWAFVPMIRCALGHNEDAGLARFLAGAADWDRWRDAYARDFATRNITEASLPFTATGYLDEREQTRLLLGRHGGGQSNVEDLVEGEFMEWTAREARLAALRRAAAPRQPPLEPGSPSTGDPRPLPDDGDAADPVRLSLANMVEHERLWWFLPEGCNELWVAANRPRFQALVAAHRANDARALGHALDAILATPAECLVRRRVVKGSSPPSAAASGPWRQPHVEALMPPAALR